jgi:hypothetical protein
MRAFSTGGPAIVRNPKAIRPWQFVLDPPCWLSVALRASMH